MSHRTTTLLTVALAAVAWVERTTAADPAVLPWHLADVQLDLEHSGPVESLSVRLQLFDDLPAEGHGLFLVPVDGRVGNRYFYCGVRTQGCLVGHPGEHTAVERPGYVFTQFGSKAADRALTVKGGYVMTGDHEGDIVGVRADATTKAGVYTFTLRRRKDPPKAVKEGEVAVDLTVLRDGDADPVAVGGLIFPEEEFTVSALGGFCEVVQGWDAKRGWFRPRTANDPKLIPQFRYAVGDWQVNGKAVVVRSVSIIYPKDVPQRAMVCRTAGCKDKDLVGLLDKRLRGEDTLLFAVGPDEITRTGLDQVKLVHRDESPREAYQQVLKRAVPKPEFTPVRVSTPGSRPKSFAAKRPVEQTPAEPTAEQLRAARAAVEAAGGEYLELPRPWHGLRHAFRFPGEMGDDAVAKLPPVPFPFALILIGSGVSDTALKRLAGQEHLTALSLDRTAVTDDGVEELAGLKRLRFLSLAETKVTGSGLTAVAALRELAELNLSNTPVTDSGLRELVGAPALARLDLAGTKVTDAGLKCLGGLPALVRLKLHGTAVGDAGVRGVRGLKRLTELDLSGTSVSDAGLEHVGGCGSLAYLNLSGTKVTDAGLKHVGGLTELTQLDLHSTAVTNAGLGRLVGLAKLDHLYLDRTAVTNAGATQLGDHLPGCLISR